MLKCAIVGLDSAFWPAGFWQAATDHPETEVIGACGLGLSIEEIERTGFYVPCEPWLEERGVPFVPTLDALLEQDFDIAFLSSRNTVMPALAERLIEAGKHVFAAKPMALTGDDARRYLAARDAGVVFAAGQLASTWQPWPTMLRLAREGRIGRVLSMRVMHQHYDYNGFPEQLWYSDPKEGDAFNWLGWYPVEVITAAMGTVSRVQGVGRQLKSAFGDMPDHLAGVFEMEGGGYATANVYFTIGQWGLPMHEGELIGEKGVLRFYGPADAVQLLDDDGETRVPLDEGADQLTAEFAAFVAAVQGDGEPLVSVERAVHVVDVCDAWKTAAHTATSVAL